MSGFDLEDPYLTAEYGEDCEHNCDDHLEATNELSVLECSICGAYIDRFE